MKNSVFFLMFALSCSVGAAQNWTLTEGNLWSRDAGAASKSKIVDAERQGRDVLEIKHTGKEDWALSEGRRIPVQPGDVFKLTAALKSEALQDQWATVSISVVTRKKDGETLHWTYASKGLQKSAPWTTVESTFIVPPEVDSIEPRVVGVGPSTVRLDGFSTEKTGFRNIAIRDGVSSHLGNQFLSIKLDPSTGTFSVTDRRTKRTWNPSTGMKNFVPVGSFSMGQNETKDGGNISFSLCNLETLVEYGVTLSLEADRPEIVVEIAGKGPMAGTVSYPAAFEPKPGDRLIVPMNEGIGYPVEAKDIKVGHLIAYGGHGICMAFWGQVEDATGAGMIGILETPDDASIQFGRDARQLMQLGAVWEPSMKEFRYPRKLRFVFFDQGGHVAVCKRYRDYAKQTGLFVPFSEKVKKNPDIDVLLGAANIWCWEGDKVALVREMKELGFDRILWSSGGNAEQLTELNKIPNVLTSRYDIYQDIMDPARFDEVHVHGDWTTEAWPHDINWTDPDGTWRKGWPVTPKDKTKPRIPCAVICDAKALPYARKRISKELETKPYKARFIDTTVAAPWFECYHPDHPMTRSDSRKHKMELLKLIGELGLVCGSETGHDASVPFCDYFEGMLSLGPYRVHESGRNMIQLVDEVPPQIENFQVNPALRLPLWELVYHDCTVAQWYWGDYNNKLPKVWRKRDLFNALYGTPPMYMFTRKYWNENRDRFAESYRTAATSARASAYAEMTDHRILSEDRLVQQTVFSNGVTVTVNFGDTPFKLADGSTLAPLDWNMKQ